MWLLRSGLLAFIYTLVLASGQPLLPADEVESLMVIADILKKRDWDFSVNPCIGLSGRAISNPNTNSDQVEEDDTITCNCTFHNNTACHVVGIILRGQNLKGELPLVLTRLPFLQEIDFSRNLLTGTIPREWGSMKLVNISLLGNQITGQIPKELANITTLENLNLEANQLFGSIPPELGSLPRIKKLIFTSNNLTGAIPGNLVNLSTLKDFRINDNNFTGSIPNFVQNWTNIEKLMIQASGLTGPIPPGIAFLTKLIDLRISDLSGNESSTIPPISNLRMLKNLILRNCKIVGRLPSYIGEMTSLNILDLSFNDLSGHIPDSFSKLKNINYIYLTGNSLNGTVPHWIQEEGKIIDVSYNNFTPQSSDNPCQWGNVNLFASSKGNTSGITSCLRRDQCEKYNSSLYINCGGGEVDDEGNTYEADMNPGGPSNFYESKTNWGFRSTGRFVDDDERPTNTSFLMINSRDSKKNPGLYSDARCSPLSLTYYAFCLKNGNYTINLHFAEIMLENDTYNIHAKRLFDVYIQRKRVLKDFNIKNEAGGVNIGIKRNFTTRVNDHTLDIRFYWAGKGTTGIRFSGTYGPLISAISAIPAISVNSSDDVSRSQHLSAESLSIGIVVAIFLTILILVQILSWKGCLRSKDTPLHDIIAGSFTLRQIEEATNNFSPTNKIGEGGFGSVYKGRLPDGTIIAVKQLSSRSKQGDREFLNEIGMISAVQHPHLVKLYGCAVEGDQLLLVYEYMENNSLARALFGPKEQRLHLSWATRYKICIGVAQGLAYLHGESRIKIIHRDIKPTNVLLDKNLVPKISDFGLAKLHEEDNTHMSTRVAGTLGYMAPEYVCRGYLTDKVDVYSFGIVLLEIVSGTSIIFITPDEDRFCLLDRVDFLKERDNLLELVDPTLGSNFNENEALTAINVALLCTNPVAMDRPSMSEVVGMLEGKFSFAYFVPKSSPSQREEFFRGFNKEGEYLGEHGVNYFSTSTPASASISLYSDYLVKSDV